MMTRLAATLLLITITSCSLLPGRGTEPPDEEFDIARMDLSEDDDRPGAVLSHEERMRLIRKRFPGLDRLDLVRVVLAPADRRGPCWAEVAPPQDMTMQASYGLRWSWNDLEADGWPELREQGWSGIYRTPSGTGFERRGKFEHIDLTVGSELVCTCRVGGKGTLESTRRPVRLRLRWQGEGHMPEVSGRWVDGERSVGLKGGVVSGNLVTYEFVAQEDFPKPQPQACSLTMQLQLLVEPPFL